MVDKAEASFAKEYRAARKAFIAACEHAHGDSIARVHPSALGPDGKPLFIDSIALGSRDAAKALVVIIGSDGKAGPLGSQVLVGLLNAGIRPSPGTRLVLVHALNPFGFAWQKRENEDGVNLNGPARTSWSLAMLCAIVTEDLARVKKLRVLEIDKGHPAKVTDAGADGVARVLADFRPGIDLAVARLILPMADGPDLAQRLVTRALATL